MRRTFCLGKDKVSDPILKQFEKLIKEKSNHYHNDKVICGIIENDNIKYRLKFEFFIDLLFIIVRIISLEELLKKSIKDKL